MAVKHLIVRTKPIGRSVPQERDFALGCAGESTGTPESLTTASPALFWVKPNPFAIILLSLSPREHVLHR